MYCSFNPYKNKGFAVLRAVPEHFMESTWRQQGERNHQHNCDSFFSSEATCWINTTWATLFPSFSFLKWLCSRSTQRLICAFCCNRRDPRTRTNQRKCWQQRLRFHASLAVPPSAGTPGKRRWSTSDAPPCEKPFAKRIKQYVRKCIFLWHVRNAT